MSTEQFLNVRETARELGVHENTVRNLERRGKLRAAVRLPGSGFRRFHQHDVERMRHEMLSQIGPATEMPTTHRRPTKRRTLAAADYSDCLDDNGAQAEVEGACAFCRIARGEDASAEIICQDKSWLAFFPPEPATFGHALIVPRAHVPDFWSLDDMLAGELTRAAIRVGRAIDRAVTPEGMNLITSSGEAAEQTVFHVHLHVVPRWRRDGFGRIWPPDRATPHEAKEDVADLIRAECAQA